MWQGAGVGKVRRPAPTRATLSLQLIPHMQTTTAPEVHSGYTRIPCTDLCGDTDVAEDTQRTAESLRLETWRQTRSVQSAKAFNAYWHCGSAPDLPGMLRIPGCPTAQSRAAEKRLPDPSMHHTCPVTLTDATLGPWVTELGCSQEPGSNHGSAFSTTEGISWLHSPGALRSLSPAAPAPVGYN